MIPKIIHYCWFGGNPLPSTAKKCIASWKKYCPDYKIIEWNEANFDINFNPYVKAAYEARKWAFVADVVRFYALVNYGGIYMDTDMELLKPLDGLLSHSAFTGFETTGYIAAGIMGAEPGHPLFEKFLKMYDGAAFLTEEGSCRPETVVEKISALCSDELKTPGTTQEIMGMTVYSSEYFYPQDCFTRKITVTANTISIHRYDGSWLSEKERRKIKIKNFLGPKLSNLIARFLALFRK